MCEPTSIIAGISAVTGYISQNQSAKKQSASASASAQASADQNTASKTTAIGERIKQGRIERARMAVAGGESGAGGASFEAAMSDSLFQQSEDVALTQTQARFDGAAIASQDAANQSGIERPSALTLGAKLAAETNSGLQINKSKKLAALNTSNGSTSPKKY